MPTLQQTNILDLDEIKTSNNQTKELEVIPPDFFKLFNPTAALIESIQVPMRLMNKNLFQALEDALLGINKTIEQVVASELRIAQFVEIFGTYQPQPRVINAEPIPLLPSSSNKTRMGILMTRIGTFKYKRRTLSKLSMKNNEGKVLALFMNPDLYASDENIRNRLRVSDNRNFSWVLKHIKEKFRKNGLSIEFERIWEPDGYVIRKISFLQ